jgi:hypothetical protein
MYYRNQNSSDKFLKICSLVTLFDELLIKTKFRTPVSELLVPYCVSLRDVALSRCDLGKREGFALTTRLVTRELCRIKDYFEKKKWL